MVDAKLGVCSGTGKARACTAKTADRESSALTHANAAVGGRVAHGEPGPGHEASDVPPERHLPGSAVDQPTVRGRRFRSPMGSPWTPSQEEGQRLAATAGPRALGPTTAPQRYDNASSK
jgi:hypothetical protein